MPVPSTLAVAQQTLFQDLRQRIDAVLQAELDAATRTTPAPLRAAMALPLLGGNTGGGTGGGKRLRPLLTLAAYMACTGSEVIADDVISLACAFEMMHAASLIYDDLPCMDDADMRRGQQSAHVAFGEPTALLAAIGLMNAAYGSIAQLASLAAPAKVAIVALLAQTVGAEGLAAGQYFDLNPGSANDLRMRRLKTGLLFQAAASGGAIAAAATPTLRSAVGDYADHLGTAFQLLDDLDDHDVPATKHSLQRDLRLQLERARAALPSQANDGPLAAFIDLVFGTQLSASAA